MRKQLGRWAVFAFVPTLVLTPASCSTQVDEPAQKEPSRSLSAKQKKSVTSEFPNGTEDRRGKGATKIFGPALATGETPDEAAESFKRRYEALKGVEDGDLVKLDLPPGQSAKQTSSGIGLMLDEDTQEPGFWFYSYHQKHRGRSVFRAALHVLVRNDGSNNVVWASSTLRDLSGFEPRNNPKKAAPDPVKTLRAIRGMSDSSGTPLPPPEAIASLSDPEPIVFAGSEDEETPPSMAVEYTAETLPSGKWSFVADAETGDILHVRSLSAFATVNGTVRGLATQGTNAAECTAAMETAFPYAEVDGLAGEKTYADANGAFSLNTSATGSLNVTSPMAGRRFIVRDYAGPREDLSMSVTPPGPVTFIHNNQGANELYLAQANAYAHVHAIRSFLLKYVPTFPIIANEIDFPMQVNLTHDIDSDCPGNATYSSAQGTYTISLCRSTSTFANTSFANIIHHEYAHHIVDCSKTQVGKCAGPFGGEYGEGMADAVAALFSGQHEHALGLLRNQCTVPVRDAANLCRPPATPTAICSTCGDEIHRCGQILSGIIWSIRTELAATHPTSYADLINKLTLSSTFLQQGTSISSQIAIDFLTLDDTDGNLNNGTPHYSEICAGFAAHGLSCPALATDLTVTPSTGLSAQGPVGGPFSPTSITYTVKNLGPTSTLQYEVAPASSAGWLTITNATGQLGINQSKQVTVSINPSTAAGLAKGNYAATIKFTNKTNGVGTTSRPVTLLVGTPEVIYTETFEGGLGSFAIDPGTDSLWHVSSGCASASAGHSLPKSLYFGLEGICNYEDGKLHTGSVTSVPITLSNASMARLRLNYFLGTESTPTADQAQVQVSVNGGMFWTLASNTHELSETRLQDGTSAWQAADFDLTPYLAGMATASLRVRFVFDTIDTMENAFPGFHVDDVKIVAFGGGTSNHPPTVNAGPNQTIILPASATLAGTASDDGEPKPPGKLTTAWSMWSGPGVVTFANPAAPATTATFSAKGVYTLRLTATDGALTTTSDVVITVSPSPTPCAGLCDNPVRVVVNGSYQSGNIGTGATCVETTSVVNGGNCGNFVSPRTLSVNGVIEPCNNLNWPTLPPKRNGGYCVQTTPGNYFYAYVVLFY